MIAGADWTDGAVPAPSVHFNVAGTRFEVARSTVDSLPEALLSRMVVHATGPVIFIDRDPTLFRIVLNFYRNGEVDVPPGVSCTAIERELAFFCLDVDARRVHVQNVGAHWRGRTGSAWSERVAAFFTTMFETPWFERRMAQSLELTVVMGPPRPREADAAAAALDAAASASGDAAASASGDPAVLFGTKTARRLATNVLSRRFNLMSRWEVVDAAKNCVLIEYPKTYTFYPPSGYKLHQLVLLCQVDDADPPSKRTKRGVASLS